MQCLLAFMFPAAPGMAYGQTPDELGRQAQAAVHAERWDEAIMILNRGKKGTRAEALRQAQLALKARYPNPLYWGAFICQGDPAPLPLDDKQKQTSATAQETFPPPKPTTATTAKVKWVCPGCGKALQAETKLIGKKVKCPGCGKVQAVPGPTA